MDFSYQFLKVVEILLKLLVAVLCGGMLVFDRDKSSRFNFTQILVMISLGACLLVILWELNFSLAVGLSLIFFASMIVAIGIISSAVIISHHGSPAGLIITATIWVAAGIGMSIGYSLYFTAIIATLIGYIFLRFIDKKTDSV
ncbi:MAG: MgtC/SapB family protein [Calditrichia bacterium]|nr:MgtC/SapB family protein [Calditrichia bacterium]